MTPLHRAKTVYTFDAYRKLCLITWSKFTKHYLKSLIITGAFLVLSIVWYYSDNIEMAMMFLLSAVGFPLLFSFRKSSSIKRSWKSNKIMQNMAVIYEFYEDYFTQTNSVGSSEIQYKDLLATQETPEYFYLFISINQGFAIDKSTCSEELCHFLRNLNK